MGRIVILRIKLCLTHCLWLGERILFILAFHEKKERSDRVISIHRLPRIDSRAHLPLHLREQGAAVAAKAVACRLRAVTRAQAKTRDHGSNSQDCSIAARLRKPFERGEGVGDRGNDGQG